MSFDYSWNGVDHPYNNMSSTSCSSMNDEGMVMMSSYNNNQSSSSPGCSSDEDVNNTAMNTAGDDVEELRRGPWTVEEDIALINYIAVHGEGRWNSLARCAGLNRTGKSCRLRWLNYLRPDVRRGNITPEEQLLILELHSRWGNRWSKIAQYLPGRTDNEIKNYWRTRVQKHAKQLKCDVNSQQFKDTMRYLWMPRLVERIQAQSAAAAASSSINTSAGTTFERHLGGGTGGDINFQPQQQQYSHQAAAAAQYSSNWQLPTAAPLVTAPSENLSNITSDNGSSTSATSMMGNQVALSPGSTGGGGGSDYFTYAAAAPFTTANGYHNMMNNQAAINDPSCDNYFTQQNLTANGDDHSQQMTGAGYQQWSEDVDVAQGCGDYYYQQSRNVNVNLWNTTTNCYDDDNRLLLQHQRQLHEQQFNANNHFSNSSDYSNSVYF